MHQVRFRQKQLARDTSWVYLGISQVIFSILLERQYTRS